MGEKRQDPSRNDTKEVWLAQMACTIARVLLPLSSNLRLSGNKIKERT
jgi:hypothetical protein